MPDLIAGELVAAAVVDTRVWEAQGDMAPDGVYLTGQPGPALPFVLFRAWKIPVGTVLEEVRLFGPSGRMVFRWGPEYRQMRGMFDLTTEVDQVAEAVFDETGTYVASFVVDGQVLGEIEVPVYVQASPEKLDKGIEEGLKKSDVIWVGVDRHGKRETAPVWFAYKNGKVYVLSQREPGAQEQTVPGIGCGRRVRRHHAPQAARHGAQRAEGVGSAARGRRVGRGVEDPGRPPAVAQRPAERGAHALAFDVRHPRADAQRARGLTLTG